MDPQELVKGRFLEYLLNLFRDYYKSHFRVADQESALFEIEPDRSQDARNGS